MTYGEKLAVLVKSHLCNTALTILLDLFFLKIYDYAQNNRDLPDIEGDKKFNISTFAVRAGVGNIANAACVVLALNYASAVIEAAVAPG
jgi:4-hydroxybenzoate polyprenyltransferase